MSWPSWQRCAPVRARRTLLPPRALPQTPGLVYFQINREASLQEWDNVKRSLSTAVRLNEKLVVGDIQGQRILTIRNGGTTTTVQFTLFVVEQEGNGACHTGNYSCFFRAFGPGETTSSAVKDD